MLTIKIACRGAYALLWISKRSSWTLSLAIKEKCIWEKREEAVEEGVISE
jgi:hypothetical protein